MSEQKVPEARIGQQAAVRCVQGTDYSASVGTLRGPTDRGIVTDCHEKVRCYPWASPVSLEEAGEDPGLQMGRAQ